jgi:hypothetical protein
MAALFVNYYPRNQPYTGKIATGYRSSDARETRCRFLNISVWTAKPLSSAWCCGLNTVPRRLARSVTAPTRPNSFQRLAPRPAARRQPCPLRHPRLLEPIKQSGRWPPHTIDEILNSFFRLGYDLPLGLLYLTYPLLLKHVFTYWPCSL